MARPRLSEEPNANYQVRALQRGLAILTSFSPAEPSLGLATLASRLAIPKATALRLLECLRGERFLAYDPHSGRYSLGLRAFEVGAAYAATSPLEQQALPFLRQLMARTNQTANLGVLDDYQVLHLAVVEPERPLRYHTRVGARDLLHCTGLGKVLAAELLDEQGLRRVLELVGLPARTTSTCTDPEQFRAELARVRALGYAEDREEGAAGLRCLAAPVRGPEGQIVAAMSISGAAVEFEEPARAELLAALLEAASGLSERLGWTGEAQRTKEGVMAR